ncbi:MAG TPA: LysM peptidoglycan-binding domain-containing protein [Candidatus Acidoferrum sp.]|jgi:LysM repeat protein|nr:LysM peptidoglycan-binding domain-containing protein [Candidatus Acidoferrum sp.]
MTSSANPYRCALALLAALVLSGCVDSARSQLDDEKEPHFLAGKSRVSSMDYQGAIEAFEKALEVNPQSASAHFELAWLYELKASEPAAAIYHYDKYLKLRPHAGNADLAKQHILSCKQALASTVSLGPITEKQQRDFEKMLDENKRLAEQNKALSDEVAKWRVYYAARSSAPTTSPPAPATEIRPAPSPAQGPTILVANVLPTPASTGRLVSPAPITTRTHTVKGGETLAQIARKYGIKLDALIAANPGLDPRRLQVGQTLAVPAP